jgi:hypothetical protein
MPDATGERVLSDEEVGRLRLSAERVEHLTVDCFNGQTILRLLARLDAAEAVCRNREQAYDLGPRPEPLDDVRRDNEVYGAWINGRDRLAIEERELLAAWRKACGRE